LRGQDHAYLTLHSYQVRLSACFLVPFYENYRNGLKKTINRTEEWAEASGDGGGGVDAGQGNIGKKQT
jgi:hypothetical protein